MRRVSPFGRPASAPFFSTKSKFFSAVACNFERLST
jgi:hypothetical protein